MAEIDRLVAALGLRQRDGVTCGPTVALVAGAMMDHAYRAELLHPDGPAWFAAEQGRIHAAVNRIWPRRLGTTPAGMARALTHRSGKRSVTYRWRLFRGTRDSLSDVLRAVTEGWPVPMLVGERGIPRHWVLLAGTTGEVLQCYEPSSGTVVPTDVAAVRGARLTGLGFPRPFAFVLPSKHGPKVCDR
ncbi:hypothetical protein BA059_12035 [Mycolicibacterium sp. (ex Dasyatis americana)]|nr:hypothetical protein BA059_12035 [Mycolicibacterium sp. (ex Dasyatis americana)]